MNHNLRSFLAIGCLIGIKFFGSTESISQSANQPALLALVNLVPSAPVLTN